MCLLQIENMNHFDMACMFISIFENGEFGALSYLFACWIIMSAHLECGPPLRLVLAWG